MYVAQSKESYNQNRNMVLSPASSYRMLHALCVASQDKTQRELRQLVSCKPRDSKKISASVRKIGKKQIKVNVLFAFNPAAHLANTERRIYV